MPRLTKYWLVLVLTGSALTVELVGHYKSSSLALLSDAVHVFVDLVSVLLAIITYLLARKFTTLSKKISGWGGIVSAILLLPAIGFIFVEALGRLFHPVDLHEGILLLAAVAGAVLNRLALLIMGREHSCHVAEEVHKITDLALTSHIDVDLKSSYVVIVGSLLIFFTGQNWIDLILSLGISVFLFREFKRVITQSIALLN